MSDPQQILLGTVLGWLDIGNFPKTREKLDEFLSSRVEGWLVLVECAFRSTIDWGKKKLDSMKSVIVKTCREDRELISSLTKLAAKTGVRVVAEVVAKETGRAVIRNVTSRSARSVVKVVLKTAVNPVAIFSDIAQGFLQYFGYVKFGRSVGLLGNIGPAAVTGFVAGGPLGAAIGIVVGGGIWLTGEFAGAAVDHMIG